MNNFLLIAKSKIVLTIYITYQVQTNLYILTVHVSVIDCDDLSCGENEICVEAGDTYQCVCHPDYEGRNCENES